jgi:hypothetical protein
MLKLKRNMSPLIKAWSEKLPDQNQFVAALQQSGTCHLHGVHTEQGAESNNAASVDFRDQNTPQAIMMGMLKTHAKQHNKHEAGCARAVRQGQMVPPKVAKELVKLAPIAETYTCVKCIDQNAKTYEIANMINPGLPPYIVSLSSGDFNTRCCKMCARDHKLCARTAAAVAAAGIPLETLVHESDTVDAWQRQCYPNGDGVAAEFRLPRGGASPDIDHEGVSFSTVKLNANDDEPTKLWMPPFVTNPRGRPKKKRQERMTHPYAKAMRCSKCKMLTRDHRSANCKGASELSNAAVPLQKTAVDTSQWALQGSMSRQVERDEEQRLLQEDEENREYIVAQVVRYSSDQEAYLVKWKGYGSDDDSWVEQDVMAESVPHLVVEFNNENALLSPGEKVTCLACKTKSTIPAGHEIKEVYCTNDACAEVLTATNCRRPFRKEHDPHPKSKKVRALSLPSLTVRASNRLLTKGLHCTHSHRN